MTGPVRLVAERCTVRNNPADIPTDVEQGTPAERMRPQQRGLEALRRGLEIRTPGFNVAVVGPRGTGRTFVSLALAEEEVARRPPASDLVLLPNPRGPLEPIPAEMPPGTGPAFVRAMRDMHTQLEAAWHDVLDGDGRNRIALEVQREQSADERRLRNRLSEIASRYGLALVTGDDGFEFVPVEAEDLPSQPTEEDEPEVDPNQLGLPGVEAEDDDALTRNRQYVEAIEHLTPYVEEVQRELALLEAQAAHEMLRRQRAALRRQLDASFGTVPAGALSTEQLREHVRALHGYLVEFYRLHDNNDDLPLSAAPIDAGMAVPTLLTTSDAEGDAPLVHAQNPTLSRMFGRVVTSAEETRYPAPGTILAGDLHRANGGILVIEAEALIRRERVYEHLKSCLLAGTILPLEEGEGQILRPHPIELQVKVILIADPDLLTQLQGLDPEFSRLFKIRADFTQDMSRADAVDVYPRFCTWLAHNRDLPPCDASALAALLTHGARLAEDQHRATAELGRLGDVVTEAAWLSGSPPHLDGGHIRAALEAARERDGLLRDRILDLHEKGTMRVEVTGRGIGQINGLAVVSDGFAAVGRPMRVTAVTYAGGDGPFNIDREVELSGPLHSKGVLILAGYLSDRFARLDPLNFGASVVFEQSYGLVEGDSASMAELLAILSSLAEIPARQDIAITGSVDQRGRALPVGGVNEKIEGFFDLCSKLGPTGDQGVVIPRQNVLDLVLREDVLKSVAQEQFHIWSVDSIDDAVEVLLGLPAGNPADLTGAPAYADGSVYRRISDRLATLHDRHRLRHSPPG